MRSGKVSAAVGQKVEPKYGGAFGRDSSCECGGKYGVAAFMDVH